MLQVYKAPINCLQWSAILKNRYNEINPVADYDLRYTKSIEEEYLYWTVKRKILSLIQEICGGKIVLDLGCGTGEYTREIEKCAKVCFGIDSSIKMLSVATTKCKKSKLIMADALNLPLESSSSEVIFCVGLIRYVNAELLMREIDRVAKPGCIIVIVELNNTSAYILTRKVLAFLKHGIVQKEDYPSPSLTGLTRICQDVGLSVTKNTRLNVGMIWLPNFLGRRIKIALFTILSKIMDLTGLNLLSHVILLVAKKG
jgi:SAM-dependent methyltransferase